ncbi:MAG: PTS sugar transporter subunit IIA [Pseudomonadota bacterium]
MDLEEIIKPNSVLCNAHARSKKHSIEILSELLSSSTTEYAAEDIFERLVQRERLGCTSLNAGVAFPHCRIEGLEDSCAAMIKLSEPVEFDAPDGEPVDVIFGMLVPDKLEASQEANVREVVEMLRDETLRARLRAARTSNDLYSTLLAGPDTGMDVESRAAQGTR